MPQRSRFQREKEERELKRRQDESEAASVYETFVASFGADVSEQRFVRPGDEGPSSSYAPQRAAPGETAHQPPAASSLRSRQKRQIDEFLVELKTRQASGESKLAAEEAVVKGSFDDGDPSTTNLYVGNLAPTITEEKLTEVFGQYGKIDSVKIMWPRTDEERSRRRNCGFVSFVSRDDADDAKLALNEVELDGYKVSVGWGKAVGKRTEATTASIEGNTASSATTTDKGHVVAAVSPAPVAVQPDVKTTSGERTLCDEDPRVQVTQPEDVEQRDLIDLLARYVSKDGAPFEAVVRDREQANPLFAFLRLKSPEATYYRWKVYANLMDNELEARKQPLVDRTSPYLMQRDGVFWVPPLSDAAKAPATTNEQREEPRPDLIQFLTGRQAEKARDRERGCARGSLHPDDHDTLKTLVLQLTLSRAKIAEAMCFALDHVESAADVVDVVEDALVRCEPTTSLSARVARLYLVSDLLRNSSAPIRGAQHYRSLLQAVLPDVLAALNAAARATASRIANRSFEDRVVAVLGVWLRWAIFPPTFLHGLEATFLTAPAAEDDCYSNGASANLDALDTDGLRRKARIQGLQAAGDRDALVARLARAHAYVKCRALGLEPRSAMDQATANAKREADQRAVPVEPEGQDKKAPEPSSSAGSPAIAAPPKKSGTWVDAAALDKDDDEIDGEAIDIDVFNSIPDVAASKPPANSSPEPDNRPRPADCYDDRDIRPPAPADNNLHQHRHPRRRFPVEEPPLDVRKMPRARDTDEAEMQRKIKRNRRSPSTSSRE